MRKEQPYGGVSHSLCEWGSRPDLSHFEGPFFEVFAKAATHRFRVINVLISPSDIRVLEHDTTRVPRTERIRRAVIRYAIQRIEHGLRDELFP